MTEFPSESHRRAHIEALERELAGCRRRAAEAENFLGRARDAEQTVAAELARLAPKAKGRPARTDPPQSLRAAKKAG